jgi:hypothetical protein
VRNVLPVTLDALAYESQFLDHLAPVWRALPESCRGTFYVDPALVDRARARGVDPQPRPRPPHTSHVVPPNNGARRPALVASYGDTKEARRFGYGPLAFLEHGIGQSYGKPKGKANGSYSGGPDRDDTTLFLVPGPDPAARWREAYPRARVEVVGSPRLDDLPRRTWHEYEGYRFVIAVSFHWPAPISVSGYAGSAIGEHSRQLEAIAKAYETIGHAHPKGDWPQRAARTFAKVGIPFVPDFDEVCRRADVYICDNSSTIYEFAATGRPVILLNASTWSRRGPELGLRFWAASHVGQNVAPGELQPGVVARALELRPDDVAAREDALDKVYAHRSGAAERAAAAIVDWLGARREVAA